MRSQEMGSSGHTQNINSFACLASFLILVYIRFPLHLRNPQNAANCDSFLIADKNFVLLQLFDSFHLHNLSALIKQNSHLVPYDQASILKMQI